MMDALFTFIFFLLLAAVPVILVFLILELNSGKQTDGGVVVGRDLRRVARMAGFAVALCLILFLIWSLMDDEGHPYIGGALKLIFKLIVLFVHAL